MNNPAAALTDYSAALSLEPKMASSLYGRGVAERMLGNNAAAEIDMAAAKQLDPEVADNYARWGIPPT
jgi:hypothetical protein